MRRIRKYLSRPVTESLVHAFITSRVDYCNSLLYGLPNSHVMKLQRIQNAAAGGWSRTTKILPCYTIAFQPSLASDKLLYNV